MCDLEMLRYALSVQPVLAKIESKWEENNNYDRHSVS
jgi:hypothetical protein